MRKIVPLILLIILLSNCASMKTSGTFQRLDESKFNESTDEFVGVPYVWGGTTKSGVDCSGFTTQVYKDQGILLPRTSKEQYKIGKTINKQSLKKGDLLFFNTFGNGVSHVGIYVDDHRMIHASSSDGVKYAKFDTPYWQKKYIGAKRVVGSPYIKGELSTENVAVMSEFPMRITSLVNVPSPFTLDKRHYSMDFCTDIAGDLQINTAIAFWNRIQFGGTVTVNNVLGTDDMKFVNPGLNAKFRFWNEGKWYPAAAIGYDNSKFKLVQSDSLTTWSNPRGVYSVFTKTVWKGWKFLLGECRSHIGIGSGEVHKDMKANDMYMFVAFEQQVIRRVILVAEIDDIFRSGRFNTGMRIALTGDSSMEFSLNNMFENDIETDKILRFTYYFTY